MKKNNVFAALAVFGLLSGCNYVEKVEFKEERAERAYRTAMEDYRAGRLDEAIKGLKKVTALTPANASARFQLACLLQDHKKDYLGAYCAYSEYLLQRPDSDKTTLATERLKECEREIAGSLALKYHLNESARETKTIEELNSKAKKLDARIAKLTRDLESSMRRTVALNQENERLKSLMRSEADEPTTPADQRTNVDEIKAAMALLDEARADAVRSPEADTAEAKALLDEAAGEESPIIRQTAADRAKRDAEREARKAEKSRLEAEAEKAPKRPESYVVQEGDTLYKIAVKFYGRSSAWKQIREANKAAVSTDGRLKTGQKLTLP